MKVHLSDLVNASHAQLIRQYARENPFLHYHYHYQDDISVDNVPGREELWLRKSDIPYAIRYSKHIVKNRELLQYASTLGLHFKSWHDGWVSTYHYVYHQYDIQFSEPLYIDPKKFTKSTLNEESRLFRRKCINYMRRMVPFLDVIYYNFHKKAENHPNSDVWKKGFNAALVAHIRQFIPEESWLVFEQRWHLDVERDIERRRVLEHPATKHIRVGMARFENDTVWGWSAHNDTRFRKAVFGQDPGIWLQQCFDDHPAPYYVVHVRPSHYHIISALTNLGDHIVISQEEDVSDVDHLCREHLQRLLPMENPNFLPEKAHPKIIQPYEWLHPGRQHISISANPQDYLDHVHVFTDASLQEDGRNGMAAVVEYNNIVHEYTHHLPWSDNIQTLEIEAAVLGLLQAHAHYPDLPLALFSDNECVVMLLQQIQHHGYIQGRWSDVFPKKRCKELQPLLAKTAVRWMKGHVHYPGNARADTLATNLSLSFPCYPYHLSP